MVSNSKSVETNFKIIGTRRVNIEMLLILNKIRSMIHNKEKGLLTINVDASKNDLTFEYLINGNEIDPLKINNEFIIE